jgi:hypothetical protein
MSESKQLETTVYMMFLFDEPHSEGYVGSLVGVKHKEQLDKNPHIIVSIIGYLATLSSVAPIIRVQLHFNFRIHLSLFNAKEADQASKIIFQLLEILKRESRYSF